MKHLNISVVICSLFFSGLVNAAGTITFPVDKHYICDGHVVVYTKQGKPDMPATPQGRSPWGGHSLFNIDGSPIEANIEYVCNLYQKQLKKGGKVGDMVGTDKTAYIAN